MVKAGSRHSEMAAHAALLLLAVTVATLFTTTLTLIPTLGEKTCPDGDYLVNGICCNKCPPGFKLVEKCVAEGMRTNCTKCGADEFMDHMNYYPKCMRCRQCKSSKNEVEVSKCERDRNTLCRCKEGYYTSTIDTETTECHKCSLCNSDEREVQTCTAERNTVCECKEGYYRVKGKCGRCKSCGPGCKHLCKSLSSQNPTDSEDGNGHLVHVLTAVVVVAVTLLMLIIFYMATKRLAKKTLLKPSSGTQEASLDSQGSLFPNEDLSIIASFEAPESATLLNEHSKLPDCVPLEIKTHDLIYTLLDQVPVQQVKQLVRSLGVTETVIERAELDHRASKEAHYQMLKAWAEMGCQVGGGGGGRGGILHSLLLRDLLLKLRLMHLGGVAEELETKYNIH
ncbi:tumor necrosis factor receptor superfamily member 1A [Syngnathoides biaculeatus]|uniref:tumor necrosis factor receptor superfamily member 1A n=1 Tax=Syngnathoides biaculeatus TaxID=300417 RepID=UPI002ADE1266|nr:tumor necrosis factor receptor superfamily member 1A [Syngnathoides biaculeatus]XP_061675788.1 tumor necrosis factor receptor superfamily member 1A [Syngnathoides biaculeatus]